MPNNYHVPEQHWIAEGSPIQAFGYVDMDV
jgi:hypothetical protein